MPELPEVETVVRGLRPFMGRKLLALQIIDDKVWFESPFAPESLRDLELLEVSRRGKYILLRFAGGLTLVQHLRMTGKMLEADSAVVPPTVRESVTNGSGNGLLQVRCRFHFSDAELLFFDTRRFGTLTLIADEERFFREKGIAPDPIAEPIQARLRFFERLSATSRVAKVALLDQAIVAGVGNIYADEALHAAGIHPRTPARNIREPQILWKHILRLLERSINLGGTTIRDYVNAGGKKGQFAPLLLVYDRAGECCKGCGAEVERIILAGRATHFCPHCQPRRPKATKNQKGRIARSRGAHAGGNSPRRPLR